jgi:predicted protein tyrosine phosphatase
MKKKRHDKICLLCKKSRAIYAIQNLFLPNGKVPKRKRTQIRTRPIICDCCASPDKFAIPVIITKSPEQCKDLICKYAENSKDRKDYSPILLYQNPKSIELANKDPLPIWVMSRQMVGTMQIDAPHIVISITNPGSNPAFINQNGYLLDIHRVSFDDADKFHKDGKTYNIITEKQAKDIWHFVKKNKWRTSVIVCHCEAGRSRSAGVAAALSKIINGTDEEYFKKYTPNSKAYAAILKVVYGDHAKQ